MYPVACCPKSNTRGPGVPSLPAGATARWDASVLSGNDGDLIATFEDIIGTNDGTAAGSARATLKTGANGLNGLNVLRFDGVANAYDLTAAITTVATWTLACVIKRNGTEASPLAGNAFFPGCARSATQILSGDNNSYGSASDSSTGWEVIVFGRSGGASFGMRNGVPLSFSNNIYANASNILYIGKRLVAGQYSSMDLADNIFWGGVELDADQQADVCANLNAKWGAY